VSRIKAIPVLSWNLSDHSRVFGTLNSPPMLKKKHQVSQDGVEFEAFVPASFSRAGTPHGFFEIKRFSV